MEGLWKIKVCYAEHHTTSSWEVQGRQAALALNAAPRNNVVNIGWEQIKLRLKLNFRASWNGCTKNSEYVMTSIRFT